MATSVKSFLSGFLSGLLVSYILVFSIAMTAAIAMPEEFNMALWDAVVVFGLGAFLPTVAIYFLSLVVTRPNMLVSLSGFYIAVITGLSVFAELTFAGSALSAVVLGALAATALASLWPNNPSSEAPLHRTA